MATKLISTDRGILHKKTCRSMGQFRDKEPTKRDRDQQETVPDAGTGAEQRHNSAIE